MSAREVARRLLEGAAVACPLLVGLLVPARLLPGPLAFLLSNGWWLAGAGIVATIVAVGFRGWAPPARVADALATLLRGRRAWPVLLGAGFLAATLGLPGWRLGGNASGDEPKYLRTACSLWRDLDADVSWNQEGPLTVAELARNVQRLARTTLEAAGSLLRGEHPPADHAWSLGNWTVHAWHGGAYHVQGPGLSALLAPVVGSEWEGPTVPRAALALMAVLFAMAYLQTTLLAGEVAGSRLAGAAAAALVALSPAVFVGGYHLYPDAVAVALVPWIARHAWSGGPPLRAGRIAALGLAAGALVWVHVKFLLLAVVAVILLARRLGRSRPLVLLAVTALAPVGAWLLFQHRLTGLLRPDALYVRFGSEVWNGLPTGPWLFVSGLGNGLFGARDGLFVMVPAASVAALGVPWLWYRDRQATLTIGALFASIWCAAALHGGGAPGPPGRLLAPSAPLLAAPLAVALRQLRHVRALRWSVATAAILSLVAVTAMGANWRRTVNPYRGLSGAAELGRDLPGSHADPGGAARDLARATLLTMMVALWAWRFRRLGLASSPGPAVATPSTAQVWREAVAFQAGGWLTLVLGASALRALSTLAGG